MSAEIIENEMITAKPNSAVASQPCPSGHITRAIRFTSFAQIGLRRLRIARNR
jgi:hypothetical protein